MTNSGILVDTWAWLEMMGGSPRGDRARDIILNSSPVSLSVLTLYELRYRLEQIKNREFAIMVIKQITDQAEVIPIDDQIGLLGGTIKIQQISEKKTMGAVDCLILATARVHNQQILTGDKHFAGIPEAICL
ncbi:MAG: PIN domain-containing protein [Methanomicrobiales archaeon]